MTSVALPYYSDGSCNFVIFFEFGQYPRQNYIHEFCPGQPMLEWLDVCGCGCGYCYRTICTRSMMSHLEVSFEDGNKARMFKLMWG